METTTADLSLSYSDSGFKYYGEEGLYYCRGASSESLVLVGFSMGISLCGLVGNGIVMWVLIFHMKQNPFTVYVLNLAIADFSLLLFLLVYHTSDIISITYCDSSWKTIGKLSNLYVVLYFCYFTSMYLLTAMSVERCLAALFPIWYRCHRPKHLSGIVCGVLWALAAIFISSIFLSKCIHTTCKKLLKIILIVNYIIFCSFPLVSNLALFIKLRCGTQRQHPGKLYVAILLSLLCFFIFGLPFSTQIFFLSLPESIFYLPSLLASLNSSINPVIYFLVGSCQQCQFQCSVKVAFRRLFEEKATSEERSQVPGEPAVGTSV